MENWKKRMKVSFVLLFISLLVILIGFISYFMSYSAFNHTERFWTLASGSNDCSYVISPRGGPTDEWEKPLRNDLGENASYSNYFAKIYDAELVNTSPYEITEWQVKVNIHNNCYINNAWCGTLEIHQNIGTDEKVQLIDLRNYQQDAITLDYYLEGPDLMIPLYEGDYFVYIPSEKDGEACLKASDVKNELFSSINCGLICYSQEKEMDFSDIEVKYFLSKNILVDPAFITLGIVMILWGLSAIVLIILMVNFNKAQKRISQDESIIEQSLNVFTRFVDAKDRYTNGHSQRVAIYSRMIAEKMGLSEEECRHIFYIALMHDCGKVTIPDSILKKPERLTEEEYEIIKTHTSRGAEMLADFSSIDHIREGALYHHERYDGSGYPQGKKGKDIPMIGRIICVADSFDAMNSKRCYRNKLTKEKIVFELESNKGLQFDPEVVDQFLALIKDGQIDFDINLDE